MKITYLKSSILQVSDLNLSNLNLFALKLAVFVTFTFLIIRLARYLNRSKDFSQSIVDNKGAVNKFEQKLPEQSNGDVFITKASFLKILFKSDIKKATTRTEFDFRSEISPYLNWFELKKLAVLNEALSDFDKYYKEKYKRLEKAVDTEKYVYESIQSAYHLGVDCEHLNKDYFNFEIPELVKEQGRVKEFREWFDKVAYLVKTDRADIFAARLQSRFGVLTNKGAIKVENSGILNFLPDSINFAAQKVRDILIEIDEYRSHSYKRDVVLKYFAQISYMGGSQNFIYNNHTGFSDEEVKEILREFDINFKRPLVFAMEQYIIVKQNPTFAFKEHVLLDLGFKPCATCKLESIENS